MSSSIRIRELPNNSELTELYIGLNGFTATLGIYSDRSQAAMARHYLLSNSLGNNPFEHQS